MFERSLPVLMYRYSHQLPKYIQKSELLKAAIKCLNYFGVLCYLLYFGEGISLVSQIKSGIDIHYLPYFLVPNSFLPIMKFVLSVK